MNKKIFFLGAGKMATAIAGGAVKKQVFAADEVAAFDVSEIAAAAFREATGIGDCSSTSFAAAEQAPVVLLAVKPQMLADAVAPLAEMLRGKLVISIVAGVTLARLAELTGATRIVRVMPNTPALVGCGAAAFAPAPGATGEDVATAEAILSAVGIAMQVPERDLDAVTALSGSGPAYVFKFIQALADGGVAEGLGRCEAVLGAAQMVLVTGKHPMALCDDVTSPAGTTSRALEFLDSRAFGGVVMQSVRAAAARSREFGKK